MTTHSDNKPTLQALAEKYGCDKLHSHSYINFYSELFAGRSVKRLLELGIGYEDLMRAFTPFYVHGASLKMWEEYFPDALIYAMDIRSETLIHEGRIDSVAGDQSNPAHLLWMGVNWGPFDIVIDDGSHQTPHQIISAQCLRQFVAEGGVYVIEDVTEPERIVEALGAGEIHRFDKRPDDCLVVIRK